MNFAKFFKNLFCRTSGIFLLKHNDAKKQQSIKFNESFFFFLLKKKVGIHSMQGLTATTRHGVTRKEAQKRLHYTENLFRKNLQLKDVC